jgi:hypothetical protein
MAGADFVTDQIVSRVLRHFLPNNVPYNNNMALVPPEVRVRAAHSTGVTLLGVVWDGNHRVCVDPPDIAPKVLSQPIFNDLVTACVGWYRTTLRCAAFRALYPVVKAAAPNVSKKGTAKMPQMSNARFMNFIKGLTAAVNLQLHPDLPGPGQVAYRIGPSLADDIRKAANLDACRNLLLERLVDPKLAPRLAGPP